MIHLPMNLQCELRLIPFGGFDELTAGKLRAGASADGFRGPADRRLS